MFAVTSLWARDCSKVKLKLRLKEGSTACIVHIAPVLTPHFPSFQREIECISNECRHQSQSVIQRSNNGHLPTGSHSDNKPSRPTPIIRSITDEHDTNQSVLSHSSSERLILTPDKPNFQVPCPNEMTLNFQVPCPNEMGMYDLLRTPLLNIPSTP